MDRMISDEEVVEIGRKLKELREKLMLTQQEFADLSKDREWQNNDDFG